MRKKVGDIRGTLPQGIVGPGFNDEFGDTYGIVYGFTADGFTHRELRDAVDDVRKQLLERPDISKIDVLGAQDERVYVEFSTEQLAGLGIDRAALIAALNAQNAVTPHGVVQTGDEKILVRVAVGPEPMKVARGAAKIRWRSTAPRLRPQTATGDLPALRRSRRQPPAGQVDAAFAAAPNADREERSQPA